MHKAAILLFVAIGTVLLLPSTNAYAQSNLQILACDPQVPSSITIKQPSSDSLINQSTIEIAGEVFRANQIEIYVNNAYGGVIPLSFGATEFSAPVTIGAGTQTIRLVAVDLCQVGNTEASVVLTYVPNVSPSTGASTETTAGDVAGTPKDPIQAQPGFIQKYILPLATSIQNSLDLTTTQDDTANNRVAAIVRPILFLTGVGLIAGAYNIGLTGAVFRPRFNIRMRLDPLKVTALKFGIAGLGVIAIVAMMIG